MAMKRCPVCGEKYSDTYKRCPFCAEEAAFRDGGGRRKGGHRVSQKGPSMLSPVLILVIVLLAALLVYLLFGDAIKGKVGSGSASGGSQSAISAVEPSVDGSVSSSGAASSVQPEPEPELTYETASALPKTLTLSTEDFSLFQVGETHTITVSGGSGDYYWFSEDEGVASVDQSGKVTAISRGDIHIVVTDGSAQGTCMVRVKVSESAAATQPAQPSASTGGTLKVGSAKVINGGNGVRVRSGPGTNYEALATVANGASVQIVESAGDGWYKITFSGVGGVSTSGYMKGEFLQNT